MRRSLTAGIGIGIVGIALVGGVYFLLDIQPSAREPDVQRGASLYAEYCASCHGTNLKGQPDWRIRRSDGRLPAPPHDETGHTWHHPDQQLFDITKFGSEAMIGSGYKSDMMGFGDTLNDAEIWDILAFIKSNWPDRERQIQEQSTRQSEGRQ
jgi:mono/diheme cytochrome c family protein